MWRMLSCWTLLMGMLLAGALANAQGVLPQFSADVLSPRGTLYKVYVGPGNVRFESLQGQQSFIGIVDLKTQVVLQLVPSQRMYREATADSGKAAFFRLLQPIDPGNPCPQMLEIIRAASPGLNIKLLECKSSGGETVNGRSTAKWGVVTYPYRPALAETGYFWIDPALHFIVKAQGANGVLELRKIKVGPQPANLFEIPPGYQKMSG